MRTFLRVPPPLNFCSISVDFFDPDVAEGDFIAMAAEADVPCLLPKSRVGSSIDGLSLRCNMFKINIQNGCAVQNHSNLASLDGDFLTVP